MTNMSLDASLIPPALRGDLTTARALLLGALPDLPRAELAAVIAARWLTGYSGATRAAYTRDLRHFHDWCHSNGLELFDAGRSTIDAYARDLAEPADPTTPPRRPATIARRLVTLSGFYGYAVAEGVLERNPVDRVRRPRTGQDSPTLGLDRDEARRMLVAAAAHSPRAHALITLLLHDGLRISEALNADVIDLMVVRGHHVLNITRKGGARRQVVLNAAVHEAITSYLGARTEGPLFATRTGGRFNRSEAFLLVRRVAGEAGIMHSAHLSPHSLRHTFVTLAREAGVPLEDVQDAAGHADPRTTRRYDRGRHNLDRSPAHVLGVFLTTPRRCDP